MQNNLFEDQTNPAHFEDCDLGDASIREYPCAWQKDEAELLLQRLSAGIPWQQDKLRIGGREIPVPRLQCWMGERGSVYGYSGIRLQPIDWSEEVLLIRRRIQELTSLTFNSVLLNYYRDGRDSVAWHADDEAELGPSPIIASVSLGAAREFQLRRKTRDKTEKIRLNLQNGSLLVMGSTLQTHWEHRLPKVKHLQEARVNLTFRNIVSSSQ
ncbi:MAG: alpha-ketoglutarate-dependent dioxygenase AlkB [Pseudomonadales bacterium]|nr:alpha-ketoglutarate-dependent dioxygenase AlkB [Pseudomonadales bacterium]